MEKIVIFKGQKIRRHWDDKQEKWYFSVVDIVEVLTGSTIPKRYWSDLKRRLINEGSQMYDKIVQLKFQSNDGKFYLSDAADTETMLRIIQTIPSPNAEPFKLWLARVGYERIEESEDPEKAIQRAMRFYLKRGYSKNWVNQRLKSIEIRKELTDEWETRGVKESNEFVTLTDEITFAWAGMKTKDYKKYKDLKKENIEAHILIVFLSLCISKSVELLTRYSIQKVKHMIWSVLDVEFIDIPTGKAFIKRTNTTENPMVKFLEKFSVVDKSK